MDSDARRKERKEHAKRLAREQHEKDKRRELSGEVSELFVLNIPYSATAGEVSLALNRASGGDAVVRFELLSSTTPDGLRRSTGRGRLRVCSTTDAGRLLRLAALNVFRLHGRTLHIKPQRPARGKSYGEGQEAGYWSYGCERLELGCPSPAATTSSDVPSEQAHTARDESDNRPSRHGRLLQPGMRCHWSTDLDVSLEIRSKERALMLLFTAPDAAGTRQRYRAVCLLMHVVGHALVENDEAAARDAYALSLVLSCPPQLFRNEAAPAPEIGDGSAFLWLAASLLDRTQWTRTTDFSPAGVFGSCLMYRLPLRASEIHKGGKGNSLMSLLYQLRLVEQYPPALHPMHAPATIEPPSCSGGQDIAAAAAADPVPAAFRGLPFPVSHALACLTSSGRLCKWCLPEGFLSLLCATPVDLAVEALERMNAGRNPVPSHEACNLFKAAVRWLQSGDEGGDGEDAEEGGDAEPSGAGIVTTRTAHVTPTRTVFCPPEVERSNRVLRHWSHLASRFLRVTFTLGEDLVFKAPGFAGTDAIYGRISRLMSGGIRCAGRHYHFLAFSSSQIREASCWMFAATDAVSAETIRGWMGNFEELRVVAKCAARMGQCFSSTVQVAENCSAKVLCTDIPDVERNGHCFSDGVGRISPPLAAVAAARLTSHWSHASDPPRPDRTPPPSALQFLYKGCKVVLQTKFECPGSDALEAIRLAQFLPGFMNREIILLLSCHGVPDRIFLGLQHAMTARLNNMLRDAQCALDVLFDMGAHGTVWGNGVAAALRMRAPIADPFVMGALRAVRGSLLQSLRTRARVLVPQAARLIGVMDETDTLEYGQVFLQVAKKDGLGQAKLRLIQGSVVVLKNPCLHPGDCLQLQAVDVPQLRHLTNVLVFPSRGHRPHPDECSGGDLDGDEYFVSWAPDLIPPLPQSAPMDYRAEPATTVDGTVQVADLVNFFINFQRNSNLGVIAHAHLAMADASPSGVKDERCKELARLASVAVDFPKTGVPATVPPEYRPQKYPDFMEKKDKLSYSSEKVLGKLYRAAKDMEHGPHAASSNPFLSAKWEVGQLQPREVDALEAAFDEELLYDGFERCVEEALHLRDEYNEELLRLMNHYGVYSEGQLISGHVPRFGSRAHKRSNHNDVKERIKEALVAIRRRVYAEGFESMQMHGLAVSTPQDDDGGGSMQPADANEEDHGGRSHTLLQKHGMRMASAWYWVTYSPDAANVDRLFSFPWIAHKYLAAIKMEHG
eukprot:jgi/Tetstr1/447842/TSEL_003759.t1